MQILALCSRFVLGYFFVISGAGKLPHPAQFRRAVYSYRVLPEPWVGPIAKSIPGLEVAAGALLLAGAAQRATAAVLGVLLVSFSIAIAMNLIRGREIDCGCSGPAIRGRITWAHVGQDIFLTLLAIVVLVWPSHALAIDGMWGSTSKVTASDGLSLAIASSLALISLKLVAESRRLSRAYAKARLARGG